MFHRTEPESLCTAGYLAQAWQVTPADIEKAAVEAGGIHPLTINGIRHFDGAEQSAMLSYLALRGKIDLVARLAGDREAAAHE